MARSTVIRADTRVAFHHPKPHVSRHSYRCTHNRTLAPLYT